MATQKPLVLVAGAVRELSATDTLPPAALPPATTAAVGGVKAGVGLAVAGDGTLSAREAYVAVAASAIDLSLAAVFSKTITGATTFTLSNVPAAPAVPSFVLELTNGGVATVTWWAGLKWAGGAPPALTAAGLDILGFYTRDGGTTWRGMLLSKDNK